MFHRFAKSIDINDKDPVVHKNTPYIVILVRLAEKWADAHDGNLPSTRQEKKEFKVHSFSTVESSSKQTVSVFRTVKPLTKLLLLSGSNSSPYA
jgi:NEDD8-activating enzyme E1 regulatory subunit